MIFALACTVAPSGDNDAPRIDSLGAALIGAAVAISVFAILEAPDRRWNDSLVWGGLVAGSIIAAVFGIVEFRLVLFLGTLLMAVGFLCMHGLDLNSTYFEFPWPTLILATGIGLCTAPTSSAIMAAVPDEKQGIASAVNDTSREMGRALGIAVAGSILAGRYSQELAPRLAGLPPPVRGPATDSLAKAVEVAGKLGPQGRQLADLSKDAFTTALHASTMAMAVIVGIAAVLIGCGPLGVTTDSYVSYVNSLNEFRSAVGQHHDSRVRTAAGDRRQDRPVDHPQVLDAADPTPMVDDCPWVTLGAHRRAATQMLRCRPHGWTDVRCRAA